MTAAPLTHDQIKALADYAKKNGRTWKSKLRTEWMNASAEPVLHALRNTHGPAWLQRFQFADA